MACTVNKEYAVIHFEYAVGSQLAMWLLFETKEGLALHHCMYTASEAVLLRWVIIVLLWLAGSC